MCTTPHFRDLGVCFRGIGAEVLATNAVAEIKAQGGTTATVNGTTVVQATASVEDKASESLYAKFISGNPSFDEARAEAANSCVDAFRAAAKLPPLDRSIPAAKQDPVSARWRSCFDRKEAKECFALHTEWRATCGVPSQLSWCREERVVSCVKTGFQVHKHLQDVEEKMRTETHAKEVELLKAQQADLKTDRLEQLRCQCDLSVPMNHCTGKF